MGWENLYVVWIEEYIGICVFFVYYCVVRWSYLRFYMKRFVKKNNNKIKNSG